MVEHSAVNRRVVGSNPTRGANPDYTIGIFYFKEIKVYKAYVLYSSKFDEIYIGQTNDLEYRLEKHNSGKSRYTKRYIPWEVVYFEEFETRTEAMKSEKELKSHKGREFIRKEILNGRVRQSPD